MDFAADARRIKINLNVLGFGYLFAPGATRKVFAFPARHANGQQTIPGNNSGAGSGRTGLDGLGDHALRCVDPGNAVRWWWLELRWVNLETYSL